MKIQIDIKNNISPTVALEAVRQVIAQGKISEGEKGKMKALAYALSLAKNCGEENAFDLRTLYEQLKKLRKK